MIRVDDAVSHFGAKYMKMRPAHVAPQTLTVTAATNEVDADAGRTATRGIHDSRGKEKRR